MVIWNFFCITSKVLQADGGNFCACVNAATLALIDAGIPMREYVVACSASLAGETPLVDISHLEETLGGPNLTVAALPLSGKVWLKINKIKFNHLSEALVLSLYVLFIFIWEFEHITMTQKQLGLRVHREICLGIKK